MVRKQIHEPQVVLLIDKWLHAQVQGASRKQTIAGASQGGVITPLLANLYLHRFDMQITRRAQWGTLVRFADDFVILCRQRHEAEMALDLAQQTLGHLRLRLNSYKTHLVSFDEGFKFLGVFFLRNEYFIIG